MNCVFCGTAIRDGVCPKCYKIERLVEVLEQLNQQLTEKFDPELFEQERAAQALYNHLSK